MITALTSFAETFLMLTSIVAACHSCFHSARVAMNCMDLQNRPEHPVLPLSAVMVSTLFLYGSSRAFFTTWFFLCVLVLPDFCYVVGRPYLGGADDDIAIHLSLCLPRCTDRLSHGLVAPLVRSGIILRLWLLLRGAHRSYSELVCSDSHVFPNYV